MSSKYVHVPTKKKEENRTIMEERLIDVLLSNIYSYRVIVRTLGLRVQEIMLSRIKQIKINTSGALVLMQDVEIIYGCLLIADSPDVKDAFDEVREGLSRTCDRL